MADLDLLPDYFPIKNLQFSTGMESKLLHTGIWLSSWLVRLGLPLHLSKRASLGLKVSRWFDFLGSEDGGMHVAIEAVNSLNQVIHKTWYIVAKNNDGPQIPCVPAILMAQKILANEGISNSITTGVKPCINFISLDEYLNELGSFSVEIHQC